MVSFILLDKTTRTMTGQGDPTTHSWNPNVKPMFLTADGISVEEEGTTFILHKYDGISLELLLPSPHTHVQHGIAPVLYLNSGVYNHTMQQNLPGF